MTDSTAAAPTAPTFTEITNEAERVWVAMYPNRSTKTHTAAMQIGRLLGAARRNLVAQAA
jgi:hypothetical protein